MVLDDVADNDEVVEEATSGFGRNAWSIADLGEIWCNLRMKASFSSVLGLLTFLLLMGQILSCFLNIFGWEKSMLLLKNGVGVKNENERQKF